jgi:FkbM family methyltransferase
MKTILHDGIWNYDRPVDVRVAVEALSGKAYPPPPLAEEVEIKTIVDVGAHVGGAAIWFHKLWPKATIHCFEPAEDSFRLLCKNAPFARKYMLALGKEGGMRTMYREPDAAARNTLTVTDTPLGGIHVENAAVALAHTGQPDVLKIDTEGCEMEILRAALESAYKSKVIYLEYHRWDDRIAIDCLLLAGFILFHATVADYSVNRGTLAYIHVDAICPKKLAWLRLPDTNS